jgi:hypothetical protein
MATELTSCRLQFNTGIIAAGIPTLKPLVGKALKLSEYSNSRTPGNYGSRYGSRLGSQPRSRVQPDQYALEELSSNDGDRRSDEVQFKNKAAPYSTTIVSGRDKGGQGDDISSGDSLPIQGRKGIFIQTEVRVD